MPSRTFRWVSSLDPSKRALLNQLQSRMARYYAYEVDYYTSIDFTKNNWLADDLFRYISMAVEEHRHIVEIGCGRANILRHNPELEPRYTGIDFGPTLLDHNRREFPQARFEVLKDALSFPRRADSCDCIFSTFVIEHCVYPWRFLDESVRILRRGGTLVLLCPDMLGRSRMTSQRLGFAVGTGRQKLKAGHWTDALITGYDSRVRMVIAAWWRRRLARRRPRFYINLAPLCFAEAFQPDFDAVYLTFKDEIIHYLNERIRWHQIPDVLARRCEADRLILLHGRTV